MIATSCVQVKGATLLTVKDLPSLARLAVIRATKDVPRNLVATLRFEDLSPEAKQTLKQLVKAGDRSFAKLSLDAQSVTLDFVGCMVVADLPPQAQEVVRNSAEAVPADELLGKRFEQLPPDARCTLRHYVISARAFESLPVGSQSALLDFMTHDNQSAPLSEIGIGTIHWELLRRVKDLCEERTPLDEVLDLLRWVFAGPAHDHKPLSFASCVDFVALHIESPTPFMGQVDISEFREFLQRQVRVSVRANLKKYPEWVQREICCNPDWVAEQLDRDPQWINQHVKQYRSTGDLFA